MVLVLEPAAAAEPATPPQSPPGRPAAARVAVTLALVPGRATTFRMPATKAAAAEVLSLAYAVSGRDGVETLLDSIRAQVRPDLGPAAPAPAAILADRLLAQLDQEQQWLVSEALKEIEQETRDVFLEMLDTARSATQLTDYGLLESSRGLVGPPLPDINRPGDPGTVYRAVRAAVVEIDAAARVLREAESNAAGEGAREAFIALGQLIQIAVYGQRPVGDPLGSMRGTREGALQAAGGEYAAVLARHAERFPALAAVAGTIADTTTGWEAARVAKLAADTSSYNNELDRVIRTAIGDFCRNTWEDGPRLARRLLTEADEVLRRVALLRGLSTPEGPYAYHPLWRYPVLVHTALERLGYAPGSLPHSAAADTLRLAAAAAEHRADEERATARALDWAAFGFGVLRFVPVVGQLAVLGSFAVGTVQLVTAGMRAAEQSEEARAFGPYAGELGLSEPEGNGWLLLSFAGLVFDVLPVLRACGQLAGRLVRLTALPRPETPGLFDVVGAAAHLLTLVTAEQAAAAGVRDPA